MKPWRLFVQEINGLQLNSYSSTNNIPSEVEDITAIYSSTANAGSFLDPKWTEIATPDSALAGLKTGIPYFLVLSLEPTADMPAVCTTFLEDNAKSVSLMWVTFCGCATVGNDYLQNAMSFTPYEWQNSVAFPVIPYNTVAVPHLHAQTSTSLNHLEIMHTVLMLVVVFQSDELADDCDDSSCTALRYFYRM